MLNSLFVYGSFCEGQVHFEKIRSLVLQSEPASIVGSVYRMPVGYPVYLRQGQQQIQGRAIRLNNVELALTLLDEFHGVSNVDPESGLFHRHEVEAQVVGGTESVYVYALNPARLSRTSKAIEGGDWQRSMSENQPLPQRMTDKQKNYVRKLGQCSGRDIVPIDLNLYRELLHMDLVVDKGRRLALTTLGQDVFRFLS